ncbi:ribonuclease HII [Fusobacterium ulcerans]|uniref:ribonuclease HII n=1 Tax=Fusobacterium ulcerans TaxID=861 RepID=UPI002671B3A3|nr:ribonuclease HII [Fusobacterium ulcerans]
MKNKKNDERPENQLGLFSVKEKKVTRGRKKKNILSEEKEAVSLHDFDINIGEEIIGVDEAGRGPLAGSVVAAAVKIKDYNSDLDEINDSKQISEKKRERLYDVVKEHFYVGVGVADAKEIDEINILNATFLAMRRALENLKKECEGEYLVLVDGNFKIREYKGRQEPIVKGDGKSLSIAAASIIAKVTRDRMMREEAVKYPLYGFEKHKGYGTKQHRDAIEEHGVLDIHRKSFLTKILK